MTLEQLQSEMEQHVRMMNSEIAGLFIPMIKAQMFLAYEQGKADVEHCDCVCNK